MRHKKAIFGALFAVGLLAGCGSSGSGHSQQVVVVHDCRTSAPPHLHVVPRAKNSPLVTKKAASQHKKSTKAPAKAPKKRK